MLGGAGAGAGRAAGWRGAGGAPGGSSPPEPSSEGDGALPGGPSRPAMPPPLAAAPFAASAPSLPVAPAGAFGDPEALASQRFGNVTSSGSSKDGHPEYIAYFLIPVFFLMGLLGVLICHLLKRKGYRCTAEAEQDEKLPEKTELNESVNGNNDTVGQIVDYIMKNEANADVLKAMVTDPESPTSPGSPTTPGSPQSPGSPLSRHNCPGHHLHTVGGIAGTGTCTRCIQKRWHLFSPAKKAKEARRPRPGEVTVLSVGRFRVTKAEQKPVSKDRKGLMSTSGAEVGEMPATPVKEVSKDGPVTLLVKPGSKEVKTPTRPGENVEAFGRNE